MGLDALVPISEIVFGRVRAFEGLPEFVGGGRGKNLARGMRERHTTISLPVIPRNPIYGHDVVVPSRLSIRKSALLGRKRRHEWCCNCDKGDRGNHDVASLLLRDQPRDHQN